MKEVELLKTPNHKDKFENLKKIKCHLLVRVCKKNCKIKVACLEASEITQCWPFVNYFLFIV